MKQFIFIAVLVTILGSCQRHTDEVAYAYVQMLDSMGVHIYNRDVINGNEFFTVDDAEYEAMIRPGLDSLIMKKGYGIFIAHDPSTKTARVCVWSK